MAKKIITVCIISMIAYTINGQTMQYPKTKKVDTVDTYFGTKVADPYRWLEDDKSAETAEWVNEENKVTNDYLAKIPFRDKIKARLTKMWNFPKYGVPFKEGNYYFFYKNDGMQNQSVLYIQDGLTGAPKVLLDPNALSTEGTLAIQQISVSHDAKYLAYAFAKGGSDWEQINVIELPSGKKLSDDLNWIKFSGIAWYKDGFYYSRYDEPKKGSELSGKNEYHKIYFHKVGEKQSEDKLIYENKNYPLRNYTVQITDDQQFLLMYETESTSGNALYFKLAETPKKEFVKIADGFKYEYNVVDNIEGKLVITTTENAPKSKVMLVDPYNPLVWETLIPERKDEVLQSVSLIGGKIIAQYMKDACNKVYMFTMEGKYEKEIQLPTLGTTSAFSGKKEDNIAFYSFTSFTFPSTVYKYNVSVNSSSVYHKPEVDFNPYDYETKQVFYTSKDGTKIPMFIVHKKGITLDGKNPTYLYSYGGFNISLTPSFSISRIVFLENGGVFAMPNIRGGGEYGEEWHQAGTKDKKQNVFDDFIAAAEYLIKEKYTSADKLAIAGGSNGGLLVGACMTQRPDLFKVALPAVGVLDMLRFQKFTIGWAWVGDYGTSDKEEDFKYLYKYSPLHNLKTGVKYPATLVTTGDHDDRVVPAHSFKYIATLQEKYKGENPVLVRIETMAGHGSGKPTGKVIDEMTDVWSFIFFNLGMTVK